MKAYEKARHAQGWGRHCGHVKVHGGSVVLGVGSSVEGAFRLNARDIQGEALVGRLHLGLWS